MGKGKRRGEQRRKKEYSEIVSKKETKLKVPDFDIREADDSQLSVENAGKIDNLEKITLHKGRRYLTKIMGGSFFVIVIALLGSGLFMNNWTPWQQMQLSVMTTINVFIGFYFLKK